jgi:L-ribulose-5-phosphate 3-epimerase
MQRRHLLQAGLAASGAVALPRAPAAGEPPARPVHDRICLFLDHLDDFGYSYAEIAGMLRRLGIAGPDLTVRPGGLVPPERAPEELPRAAAAFRDAGLTVPMISTGITGLADATARPILESAGRLKIPYFKLGYSHYEDPSRWQSRIAEVRRDLEPVLQVAKKAGVQAGLHNHAGPIVGGALWDGWELLQPLDPGVVGFYFDPAQATIEGGNHGWKLGFHRVAPRLKMVAIKDFVWEKSGGQWRTRWCPLGEGMVRWPEFFRELARVPFPGPISLHIEYDPGGSSKADRFEKSFLAAERDLKFLRAQLRTAFPS